MTNAEVIERLEASMKHAESWRRHDVARGISEELVQTAAYAYMRASTKSLIRDLIQGVGT